MKHLRPILVSLCFPAFLGTGCAVGVKHTYDGLSTEVPYNGTGKVVVSVDDQRPYILDGDKNPNFVGIQRGGYANPFNVETRSGRPMADDMADSLVSSLRSHGFDAIAVSARPEGADIGNVASRDPARVPATVMVQVRSTSTRAILLLTLYQWKTDTYNNTSLYYDVTLDAFDAAGTHLARTAIQGEDHLGGSLWNPPEHARREVPKAFVAKLTQLLSDVSIERALLTGK